MCVCGSHTDERKSGGNEKRRKCCGGGERATALKKEKKKELNPPFLFRSLLSPLSYIWLWFGCLAFFTGLMPLLLFFHISTKRKKKSEVNASFERRRKRNGKEASYTHVTVTCEERERKGVEIEWRCLPSFLSPFFSRLLLGLTAKFHLK